MPLESRVMLQIVASVTIVIYARNMFIVEATAPLSLSPSFHSLLLFYQSTNAPGIFLFV